MTRGHFWPDPAFALQNPKGGHTRCQNRGCVFSVSFRRPQDRQSRATKSRNAVRHSPLRIPVLPRENCRKTLFPSQYVEIPAWKDEGCLLHAHHIILAASRLDAARAESRPCNPNTISRKPPCAYSLLTGREASPLFPRRLLNQFLADDVSLDLICALINLENLGVTHHFFYRVLSHVSIAAKNLNGIRRHFHGHIACEDLAIQRLLRSLLDWVLINVSSDRIDQGP